MNGIPAIPTISHPTDRPNFSVATIGHFSYWYSYRTCIAIEDNRDGSRIIRENDWGPTTGKHLAYIDGGDKAAKAKRITGVEFERIADSHTITGELI